MACAIVFRCGHVAGRSQNPSFVLSLQSRVHASPPCLRHLLAAVCCADSDFGLYLEGEVHAGTTRCPSRRRAVCWLPLYDRSLISRVTVLSCFGDARSWRPTSILYLLCLTSLVRVICQYRLLEPYSLAELSLCRASDPYHLTGVAVWEVLAADVLSQLTGFSITAISSSSSSSPSSRPYT